ncbi:MAG: protein kinase [Polyangiales bacterium]
MAESTPNTPLTVGAKFGDYEVVRLLGAGGFGSVYEARKDSVNKRVALKIILGEHGQNPELVARFMREATIVAQLNHPHIVNVTDRGEVGERCYLEMELLEGVTLLEHFKGRRALATSELVDLFLPVLSALKCAHGAGIVHRDLKPANIFLAAGVGGRVVPKVLDFGIAKAPTAAGENTLTVTGAYLGTPRYMSPEQLDDSKNVGPWSDLWAVGTMLYLGATGEHPFDRESPSATVIAIARGEFRRPSELNPDLPADFEAVVSRLLQREVRDRYQHAEEVGRDLLPLASEYAQMTWRAEFCGAQATPAPSAVLHAPSVAAPSGSAARPPQTAGARASRGRWPALLAAAGVLALLTAAIALKRNIDVRSSVTPSRSASGASPAAGQARTVPLALRPAVEPVENPRSQVTATPAPAAPPPRTVRVRVTLEGFPAHASVEFRYADASAARPPIEPCAEASDCERLVVAGAPLVVSARARGTSRVVSIVAERDGEVVRIAAIRRSRPVPSPPSDPSPQRRRTAHCGEVDPSTGLMTPCWNYD